MSPGVAKRREAQRRRPAAAAGAPVRLERWHRRSVFASFALLVGSGALWLLFHYFVRTESEWGAGPHPLEAWWLRLHGLAAMITLLVLGSLLLTHVAGAWRLARNRASGAALGAAFALLIGTGYALYYFAGEQSRPAISLVHWVIGLAAVALIVAHVVLGRRVAGRRRDAPPHAGPPRRARALTVDEGRLEAESFGLGADPDRARVIASPGGRDHG